jgi:hypothetical protein
MPKTQTRDLAKVLDAACHQLSAFLLGLSRDALMPVELKAELMRLGCLVMVAALDGDVDKHNRLSARGEALSQAYATGKAVRPEGLT